MSRSIRITLAALSAAALLGGCAAGVFDSKRTAEQTYLISAAAPEQTSAEPLPVLLSIARPVTRPWLDTERIAVLRDGHRFDYYAASRWSASADTLVQSLLLESLRGAGRLRGVQADPSPFNAEYTLQTELRDFQAEYRGIGAPVIKVTLVCTLGRIRGRESLAGYTVAAEAQAESNTMGAVVAAFESAWREAAGQLVGQTVQNLQVELSRQDAAPLP